MSCCPTGRLAIALTNIAKEPTPPPTRSPAIGDSIYGARFCAQADGMLGHLTVAGANVKPQPKNFSQCGFAATPPANLQKTFSANRAA